jgi:hypothetical protein
VLNTNVGTCLSSPFVPVPVTHMDNCGNTAYSRTVPSGVVGDMFYPGNYTYSFSMRDSADNEASCSFKVTVVDPDAPVLTCPATIVLQRDPVSCGALLTYPHPAAEDCVPSDMLVYTFAGPANGTNVSADSTVTAYVFDTFGNSASCTFAVQVVGECTGGTSTSTTTVATTTTTTPTTTTTTPTTTTTTPTTTTTTPTTTTTTPTTTTTTPTTTTTTPTTTTPTTTTTTTPTTTTTTPTTTTPTTTPVATTRAPAFPCLHANQALLYGISGSNIVRLAFDGSSWTSGVVGPISHVNLTITSLSPNGMAFDSHSGLIFMATFGGNRNSTLFSFNVSSNAVVQYGGLSGQAGSGAFRDGSFWYVDQRTDILRRVFLDVSRQTVINDTFVTRLTNGTKQYDFGDIDFGTDGKLYWLARVTVTAAGTEIAREFASLDLSTNTYTLIQSLPVGGNYGQLATGANGVFYNSNGGSLMTLSNNGALSTALLPGTSISVTDLASVVCPGGIAPATTVTTTAATTTPTTTTTVATTEPTTTVPTTTPAPTTRAPVFPCTAGSNALLYGVVAGSSSASVVRIALTNGVWSSSTVGALSNANLIFTTSSPNGIAFDSATGLLYLANFGGNRNGTLFNYNVSSGVTRLSGGLGGQSGSAAMFGGYYWYVEQRSDILHRVALHPTTQVVISDTVVDRITGGQKSLDFGDIDFGTDGRLFVSAKIIVSGSTVSRDYAVYDLNTRVYTVLSNQASGSDLNQIALGSNGVMYNSNNGVVRTLALNGALSGPLITTATVTDLGTATCVGLDLNGNRPGASDAVPFVSASQPVMLVTSSLPTGVALEQAVSSFTATLRQALNGGMELLSAVGSSEIAVSFNPTTRVLTATGAAPFTAYMSVLNSLSYLNTADPATPGTRLVDVTVTVANGMLLSMNVPVVVTLA